jgi:CheY-like chemotaxis protein
MPLRILIADDNAVFRTALRQLLEGVDYWQVVEAQDGQEAVTRALEIHPDIIILDLAMPVKDGLAAAREISQIIPKTPILMCTMHSSAQVETEAMKAGICKVLSKSESSLVIEAVRQLLPPPEPINPREAASDLPSPPLPEMLPEE